VRAPVILPEILGRVVSWEISWRGSMRRRGGKIIREAGMGTYRSGDFCVSITAAIGIPKFETGPQKSIDSNIS
jgi:hypothetical protein